MRAARERIQAAMPGIYELPLGGTAVGTGLNAHTRDSPAPPSPNSNAAPACPSLKRPDHFEAQAARDAACFLSGALRA